MSAWHRVNGVYAWKDKEFLTDGALHLPVVVFIHKETGETRAFSENYVEKHGTDYYLKLLDETPHLIPT